MKIPVATAGAAGRRLVGQRGDLLGRDHDLRVRVLGVGAITLTAGLVPRGYFKDPEKSARTFRTIDGVRYTVPGDFATIAEDGTVTGFRRHSNWYPKVR